ncbi:prolyl aminopeptidase [Maricaulis sp.]|uniref:prolyl aminopeptidase n=1 Tax=Maricaulis sp. TaxID=1486257 RepID=UPI0025C29B86|nr:prolyl aminopeptidase [Maricaulis sp.]
MTAFFPDPDIRETGRLPVSDGHELHWECCGNPDGQPLVFLHGGPGSGISAKFRRMFDPEIHNLILFDQRGTGRSTPHLSLTGNTTQHLVADIEALRAHLGIEKWMVFGPSWGSTLALVYAQAHPGVVSALVVEAVFTARPDELAWWHGPDGARRFFPDAFADFIAPVPTHLHGDHTAIANWYLDAMLGEIAEGLPALRALADPAVPLDALRQSAVYRWTEYEDRLSYLDNPPEAVRAALIPRGRDFMAAHSLIEAHYFSQACFLGDNEIHARLNRLAEIPMGILHSRYDMVCPARSAFDLAAACPHADFRLVAVNGHGMTEATQLELNDLMATVTARIG